jgi:O-methyltransferase involved in polyketide biosynthesis
MASQRIHVELGPVQETLMIPLLGRAQETEKANGLIQDPKAVEIVERLDYDFSKWKSSRGVALTCLRTRILDEYVEDFLRRHPGGTVVELGCGLNTRFERVDNGRAHWLELDLPDTIELRRRFFADTDRRRMLVGSLLDTDWFDEVESIGGPWCFISEAALIYLEEQEVRRLFGAIGSRFSSAWLALDTTSHRMVKRQGRGGVMSHFPSESRFRWACDDLRAIETWPGDWRLLASRTFLDADEQLLAHAPAPMRWARRLVPFLARRITSNYRFNLFEQIPRSESLEV